MRAILRCALIAAAALIVPAVGLAQSGDRKPEAVPRLTLPEQLSPDAAFARQLAFIRADLLIADALVKERDWVDALPHARFPREEVYGVIRADLRGYRVPPFDGDLRELAAAIRARSVKRYERASHRIEAALARADGSLKARAADWPRFTLQVAGTVLARAAEEYDIAVANGRIRHPVGYQSARGLVLEAERMIDSVSGTLAAKDADDLQTLRGNVMRLKEAFAPLYAPKQAPVEPATVQALVDGATAAARKLK